MILIFLVLFPCFLLEFYIVGISRLVFPGLLEISSLIYVIIACSLLLYGIHCMTILHSVHSIFQCGQLNCLGYFKLLGIFCIWLLACMYIMEVIYIRTQCSIYHLSCVISVCLTVFLRLSQSVVKLKCSEIAYKIY